VNPFVTGISYRTAPVELRECLAVSRSDRASVSARLRTGAGLDEVVLLSTCNRVEIYAAAPTAHSDPRSLWPLLAPTGIDLGGRVYVHEGTEALRHLFSVAGGLDSMVLGETEITGQVKAAYEEARAAGLTRGVLNRVFQTAFHIAKELRSRTDIGRGATSVGSVAVELAERIFGSALRDQTVMIIGAGSMAEVCGRHLAKKGARRVLVANRSFDRGQKLAAELGGSALRLEEAANALAGADILITATGSATLLRRRDVEELMRTRRHRSLVLIDIAVPRNIDPEVNQLDSVYLYNMDDLDAVARQNTQHRERELAACRGIIARAVAAIWPRLAGRPGQRGEPSTEPQLGDSLPTNPIAAAT
jgi:glutamyl-tRNA reductase